MKFDYAWTLAGKPCDKTPAPPPGKRTPVLPHPPAWRALFRQTGKGILHAMLAVFRAGRRQHLAFGEHAAQAFPTSPPSQNGTTAAGHTRRHRTRHALEIYGLGSAYRTVRAGLLAGGSEIGWDFSNGSSRPVAAQEGSLDTQAGDAMPPIRWQSHETLRCQEGGNPLLVRAIDSSAVQDAAGNGIELCHERWVARLGRGDDRVLQRPVGTQRAGLVFAREIRREPRDKPGLFRILLHHPQNIGDVHIRMLVVPAIEVRHHGHGRIAKLRLARELRLGHIGHADDAAAPRPVEERLRPRRKLRPLHDEVRSATEIRDVLNLRRRLQAIGKPGAYGIGQRHMRHATRTEKALLPCEGAVDELIDDDEGAGRQVLAQRANRRDRDEIGYANALQHIDIGAVVNVRRRVNMARPVARHERNGQAADLAKMHIGRGLPPRRGNRLRALVFKPRQAVKPRAPDDPQHRFRHYRLPQVRPLHRAIRTAIARGFRNAR